MKPGILIALMLVLVASVPTISARQLSDPQAGFSITIPDEYQYEPGLIDAPNVYGFLKSDTADGIGVVIFLKHLDFQSLQQQPLPSDGAPAVASAVWHGAKLDVFESSAKLKGVQVVSYRVRARVRDGAVELIVLGSPDRKQQLLAVQSQILATLDIRPTTKPSAQPSDAASSAGQAQLSTQPLPTSAQVPSDNIAVGNSDSVSADLNQGLASGRSILSATWIFFKWFGVQLCCVYAVATLIFSRMLGIRPGVLAHFLFFGIAIVPAALLGVGLERVHINAPQGWMPFAAVELATLFLAIWAYARQADNEPNLRRWKLFGYKKSRLPAIPSAELAISAAKPGALNKTKTAVEQLAVRAIGADKEMPDHDKLIYCNALDTLTDIDMAILERFTAAKPLPVSDLADGVPEPRTEESLGGLISSLRRLEVYGLVLITIPERRKRIRNYKADQDLGINRWLHKEVTILPRGEKLIRLLKECRETLSSNAKAGAGDGELARALGTTTS